MNPNSERGLMRRRRLTNSAIEEPTINITALIDVVFVILIMFIVVAPLLEIDRVDLAQGPAAREEVIPLKNSTDITISVDKENKIKLNNVPINIHQLEGLLKEARRQNPYAKTQLYHDQEASFGTYQKVKNAAETAGFEALDVIVKPG